jgi:hypothetical protein
MLWIVQRESISDPRASIVANDGEAVMAERPHHGHEFVASGPLVPRPGVEHPALPVSRQVGSDDGEVFRQYRANLMPRHVALRIAMQQQHRKALSSDHAGEVDTRRPAIQSRKTAEQGAGRIGGHGCRFGLHQFLFDIFWSMHLDATRLTPYRPR